MFHSKLRFQLSGKRQQAYGIVVCFHHCISNQMNSSITKERVYNCVGISHISSQSTHIHSLCQVFWAECGHRLRTTCESTSLQTTSCPTVFCPQNWCSPSRTSDAYQFFHFSVTLLGHASLCICICFFYISYFYLSYSHRNCGTTMELHLRSKSRMYDRF